MATDYLVLAVGARSTTQVRTRYHVKRNFSTEHGRSRAGEGQGKKKKPTTPHTLQRLKVEKQKHVIVFRKEYFRMDLNPLEKNVDLSQYIFCHRTECKTAKATLTRKV